MRWAVSFGLVVAVCSGCGPLELAASPDAEPLRDAARIDGAAPDGTLDLGLIGPADLAPDAAPAITCEVTPNVAEVAPLEPLVLAGPPGDAIRRWTWAVVDRPAGAQPVLAEFFEGGVARPDFTGTPEITFRGDRAGAYRLALDVVGQGGAALCPPIEVTVRVRPPEGLYLQLSWTSPFDDCEVCDDGLDLDLLLAPRDLACWGRGAAHTARPADARDWPPLASPEGDPAGRPIVDDAAALEAMGVPVPPPEPASYSVAVLAFDLTVDQGGPGPPAEWPADALVKVFWYGRWIGEFEARLTTTGEVQHLLNVRTCPDPSCTPTLDVVGRATVWTDCAE